MCLTCEMGTSTLYIYKLFVRQNVEMQFNILDVIGLKGIISIIPVVRALMWQDIWSIRVLLYIEMEHTTSSFCYTEC